jgi:hypothetical protein
MDPSPFVVQLHSDFAYFKAFEQARKPLLLYESKWFIMRMKNKGHPFSPAWKLADVSYTFIQRSSKTLF